MCVCVAKLNSCLELMRNILGEHFAEATMMTTAIETGFSVEQSINQLLTHSGTASVTGRLPTCNCISTRSSVIVVYVQSYFSE